MMTRWLAAVALVACGEEPARSGVDPTTTVADLTSGDIQLFCDWAIALEGGVGHSHRCEDGTTLTTQSVATCVDTVADLTCTDTIGTFEDCLLAVDGNLCLIPTTAACAAFAACVDL
jgi:hypothetical protein